MPAGAKKAARHYFGAKATGYEEKRRKYPEWPHEHAAVARLLRDAQTVLDAPVGTGRFAPLYVGRRVVGLDASRDMLDLAAIAMRENGVAAELREHDLTRPLAAIVPAPVDVAVVIRFIGLLLPAEVPVVLRNVLAVSRRALVEIPDHRIDIRAVLPKGATVLERVAVSETPRAAVYELKA